MDKSDLPNYQPLLVGLIQRFILPLLLQLKTKLQLLLIWLRFFTQFTVHITKKDNPFLPSLR